VIAWGAPVSIPRQADDQASEVARRLIEERLNAITREADRRCGHESPDPAPAPDSAPPSTVEPIEQASAALDGGRARGRG